MGSRSSRGYYDDYDSNYCSCSECEDHIDCDCNDDYRYSTNTRPSGDRRRERYDEAEADEYAMVPVPKRGGYEEGRRAVATPAAPLPPQELYEREMSSLKVEEQKIKNKIAGERLSYDVQKRQHAKELHDVKMLLLKKYPSILFNANKQAPVEN